MEIEIILVLALFIFIIGILVALFVLIKKSMIEKKYQRNVDQYLDMIDEDDEEQEDLIDKPILNNLLDEEIEFNNDNKKDIEKEINSFAEDNKIELESIKDKKTDVKKITLDLVNVLINKKNYTFISDGNSLIKNDKIKVKLQNKVYIGIVIKGNYLKEFNSNTKKPMKINLISKLSNKKIDNKKKEIINYQKEVFEEDFIPQKKTKKED